MKQRIILAVLLLMTAAGYTQVDEKISENISGNMETHKSIYQHLHQNPELSFKEFRTAEKMSGELESLGFELTRNVGGNGFVGLMKNGKGPVIMLRTDLDAQQAEEKSGGANAMIAEGLKRISSGIAQSAGLPESKYPEVNPLNQVTPPVLNNEKLIENAVKSLSSVLGEESVILVDPVTAGEDFSRYGRTEEDVPIAMFWLGTVNSSKFEVHLNQGVPLPGLHNPEFYPDFTPTYTTGVMGMSKVVLDLFSK